MLLDSFLLVEPRQASIVPLVELPRVLNGDVHL